MAAPSPTLQREYVRVGAQLETLIELAAAPGVPAAEAPTVSHWSAGKQLEHLMLSGRASIDRLRALGDGSEPPDIGRATLLGRFVLALGWIPRGRARSPGIIVPAGRPAEEVAAGLQSLRARFASAAAALAAMEQHGWRARHPVFGCLDARQWLRFLAVHNHHHLKIIADIRCAAGAL